MTDAIDPATLAAAIERRLDELRRDAGARAAAEDLVRTLMQFYGAAIERMIDRVGSHPGGAALLDVLAADSLISSVLALHDVHPHAPGVRLARAVEQAQALAEAHGASLVVDRLDADGVRLRLRGEAAARSVSLRDMVEAVVLQAVPEIGTVDLEVEPAATTLLQIQRPDGTPLRHRPHDRQPATA